MTKDANNHYFLKKKQGCECLLNPLVAMEKQIKIMVEYHFPSQDWHKDNLPWFGGYGWMGILNAAGG